MKEVRYIGPHGPNEVRLVTDTKFEEFLTTGVYTNTHVIVEDAVNYDLNNDGVFNEEDLKIAGKVLRRGRK